jgi:HTH-type transcriptional regulator / antitoxin HigA
MSRKRVTTSIAAVYGRQKYRYLELIDRFPLRPIQTENDLDAALVVIDSLVDQSKLNRAEDDYLDVLSDLVIAYEAIHYPDPEVSNADMLQSFLDDWRLTQAEAAKGAGIAESTVSEVLSGKRKLNRKQIGKLARYFQVNPGVFAFPG